MSVHPCDVLVIGGGPAGIAAAVAAARTGARTVLLEQQGFLGGMAIGCQVSALYGLFLRAPDPCYVSGGFVQEWGERLAEKSRTVPVLIDVDHCLYALPFDPWDFQRLADQVVRETRRLAVILHGTLTNLNVEDETVLQAEALVWNRKLIFKPAWVIDCTGEATAAHIGRGVTEKGGGDQMPAVVFVVDNVDPAFEENGGAKLPMLHAITRGVREKRISAACSHINFLPAPHCPGRHYIRVYIPMSGDPESPKMTELEMRARDQIDELFTFLKAEVGAFEKARLARTPCQIGIRSGRRARAQAVLTEADVMACRKYADGIARGAWPMELWGDDLKSNLIYFAENDFYEIPYRCLMVKGLSNMLVAGRCFSATGKALASARVIATTMGTGWAAGRAAAYQALGHSLASAIGQIRTEIEG